MYQEKEETLNPSTEKATARPTYNQYIGEVKSGESGPDDQTFTIEKAWYVINTFGTQDRLSLIHISEPTIQAA